jgi:hypothetical protein
MSRTFVFLPEITMEKKLKIYGYKFWNITGGTADNYSYKSKHIFTKETNQAIQLNICSKLPKSHC